MNLTRYYFSNLLGATIHQKKGPHKEGQERRKQLQVAG